METSWSCRFGRPEHRRRWQKGSRPEGAGARRTRFLAVLHAGSGIDRSPCAGHQLRDIWPGLSRPAGCCLWCRSRPWCTSGRPSSESSSTTEPAARRRPGPRKHTGRVALNWVRILAVAASLAMGVVRALLCRSGKTEASVGRTMGSRRPPALIDPRSVTRSLSASRGL